MSITWVRHGRKKFNNKDSRKNVFQHDSPLKENCYSDIEKLCFTLILDSKVPDKIICSPFLRTRQTAYWIIQILGLQHIPIEIDTNISEYLGWIQPKGHPASVTLETQQHIQPILGTETIQDVERRTELHLEKIKRNDKKINVLVVTHGIVISCIAKNYQKNINRFNELEGLTLSENSVQHFRLK